MTEAEHRARHEALHKALDELAADFIAQAPAGVWMSNTTIMKLMEWSHMQTIKPTVPAGAQPHRED